MPKGHLFRTVPGEMVGKYRGAEVRSRRLVTPVYQPVYLLTYRGVPYFTHGSQIVETVSKELLPKSQGCF